MRTPASKLLDNRWLNVTVVLASIFLLMGRPVPSTNEFLYLLLPARQWNPSVLVNDWTFSVPWYTHLVFNETVGLLTRLLPLEAVGWSGRATCWSLITLALFRIGTHFRIPFWAISLSILFWLSRYQSLAAGEWIIGGFEAKTVAYIFLLWAIDAFLDLKDARGAVLLGLAFSFHPALGFWGGLAIGCALLAMKRPPTTLLAVAGVTILFALPGAIPLFAAASAAQHGSSDAMRFYVMTVMPFHLDPFSWKVRSIVAPYVLLLVNVFFCTKDPDNRPLRFLLFLQLALGGFFALGFLARSVESYVFLLLMPCRLFPVLTFLFFLFHLARIYLYHLKQNHKRIVQVVALVVLVTLHPLGGFVDQATLTYSLWHSDEDSARVAFRWLATHTPNGTIVILPPWRREVFYLSRRAQIANWNAPAVDRLGEWRARIEAMTSRRPKRGEPPNSIVSIPTRAEAEVKLKEGYARLTEEDIAAMVESYGGEYLVSETTYAYPVVFASGDYKIYSLTR